MAERHFPQLQVGKEINGWLPAFMGLCSSIPLCVFCSYISLKFWFSQVCSFLLI